MKNPAGDPRHHSRGTDSTAKMKKKTRSREGDSMTTPDAAANNTDLWTTYLRVQLRSWIDPFGLVQRDQVDVVARPLADMAAAAISGWMSLVAGPPVRSLFDSNKTQVTQFVQQQAIDVDAIEIPPAYAAPRRRYPEPTQLEEWGVTSYRDAAEAAHYEAREPVLAG
jgi:hypothetical protein